MGFRTVHLPETWIGVTDDMARIFQKEFEKGKKTLEETLKDGYEVKQITTVVYCEALWTTYLLTK